MTSRLQVLNYVHQYVPKGTNYFDKTIRIDKNPIKTALNVCKHLISKRVYAVVVSHEEKDSSGHDLSPAAVSYTSGFYQIPVIGISSRDAAFSDKNIHVSFLRTVPPYYHQADVWLEMLSHFGYTKVLSNIIFFLRAILYVNLENWMIRKIASLVFEKKTIAYVHFWFPVTKNSKNKFLDYLTITEQPFFCFNVTLLTMRSQPTQTL